MTKPTLFIGSSSEGKEVARAIQAELGDAATAQLWCQGAFGLMQGVLESLIKAAKEFDFAVLVATPDDVTVQRGQGSLSPRDNVVFECGLFVGALGRERTFLVATTDPEMRLPSDLNGVTVGLFSRPESDSGLEAAVAPVCRTIRLAIKALGRKPPTSVDVRLQRGCARIVSGDITDFAQSMCVLLCPANVYFDTTLEGSIVEPRSVLGAVVDKHRQLGTLPALDDAIDNELRALQLPTYDGSLIHQKAGRQTAYAMGSVVRIASQPTGIILAAVTGLERVGNAYFARPPAIPFREVLERVWSNVGRVRVRGELITPVLGAGFAGLPREMALTQLLLTFQKAQAASSQKLCERLTIVVYHKDWEGGGWVQGVANAVQVLTDFNA